MSGWIKLHRTLQKWGWKRSPKHLAVFLDLLLEANHEDGEYLGTKIPKGALTTSIKAISGRTGVSHKSVRTILNHLKSTNEVAIQSTTRFTMISIVKWDEYQQKGEPSDKQVANEGQTTGKRLATNKNVKNVKNEKKGKKSSRPILKEAFSSPLKEYFIGDEELQAWLDTGTKRIHDELLDKYDLEYLKKQIKKAYNWSVENNEPRLAGTFISGWIDRDKNPVLKNGMTDLAIRQLAFIKQYNPEAV